MRLHTTGRTFRQGLAGVLALGLTTAGCSGSGSGHALNQAPGGTAGSGSTSGSGSSATAVLDIQLLPGSGAGEASFHGQDVLVLGLRLEATGSADVDVRGLTLTASGSADESATVEVVRLFEDVNGDGLIDAAVDRLLSTSSSLAPPFSVDDGDASLPLVIPGSAGLLDTVPAGAVKQWLVSLDLTGAAAPAETLVLGLTASAAVDAVESGSTLPATITGLPVVASPVTLFQNTHLLVSELCVQPTPSEFVEIYNPTAAAIDLTDHPLTDGTNRASQQFYFNVVTGRDMGGGTFAASDFHVRFPQGATIAPGAYQTIAMDSDSFTTTYGFAPDYEVKQDGATDGIPDMVAVAPDSVGSSAGLTNTREIVVLYRWDGQTDLVEDVDYVVYGNVNDHFVDKTGVAIDGPDQDTATSAYQPDTDGLFQHRAPGHVSGRSSTRINVEETGESQAGGNGLGGHDETSEDTAIHFTPDRAPTPGGP